MIDRILRAKHWLIFLLTMGVIIISTIVFYVRMIRKMMAQISAQGDPNPAAMFDEMGTLMIVMGVASLLIYLWFWAVGVGMHSRTIPGIMKGLMAFKLVFFAMVVVNLGSLWYSMEIFDKMGPIANMNAREDPFDRQNAVEDQINGFMQHTVWAVLLQIAAFGTYVYILYFCAKALKTVEKGTLARFGDYLLDMVLLMFWPIGVWILQPRINRIVNQEEEKDPLLDHLIVD